VRVLAYQGVRPVEVECCAADALVVILLAVEETVGGAASHSWYPHGPPQPSGDADDHA
jgi:hypothetical protein